MSAPGPRPPEEPGSVPASDEPPPSVIESAKAAFQAVHHDMAVLASDSLLDSDDQASDHRLRFEHPDLIVELDVSAGPGATQLSGRAVPDVARVVLHSHGADPVLVCETREGNFAFPPVPHGLVRLSTEGGRLSATVWTDWFRV